MRIIFVLAGLIFSVTLNAQSIMPLTFMDYMQSQSFTNNIHAHDSISAKKWFLSKYSGVSTSFGFFRGGNATVLAVPLGLRLNRRINDNLYGFAGLSVAPAYVNFNYSFLSPDMNKFYPNGDFLNSNKVGMYSKAELGLMYINDQKTFSISGSIGFERSTYPVFPHQQINTLKQNSDVSPKR